MSHCRPNVNVELRENCDLKEWACDCHNPKSSICWSGAVSNDQGGNNCWEKSFDLTPDTKPTPFYYLYMNRRFTNKSFLYSYHSSNQSFTGVNEHSRHL